ncbi:hypothetical protein [Barnesiella intestinihominis]|uniref:hypothetical protein n=1 Tax=Barnesiella intestinihominis TaxID=487174 RepID=UPI003A8CF173
MKSPLNLPRRQGEVSSSSCREEGNKKNSKKPGNGKKEKEENGGKKDRRKQSEEGSRRDRGSIGADPCWRRVWGLVAAPLQMG